MNDPVRDLLAECDDAERDASSWEVDFLDSIRRMHLDGHDLSRKQLEKLEEVHERLTGETEPEEAAE